LDSEGAGADITEVLGIDDIHWPFDQCQKAQALAAEAYGAEQTQFLVNGSTVGIQAMILTCVGPGDLILVAQNSHRSLYSGLLLSGAQHSFLESTLDPELLCSLPPTPDQVERGLDRYPQAKAIFLTSPTYHGACASMAEIVRLAHSRGVLVLVDEAWGAHLNFHPSLPESAVVAGADMVVQSVHKLSAGLTQTGLCHFRSSKVDPHRVASVLRHLQTSSPSSLFVASIDCARRQMALFGQGMLEDCLALAAHGRSEINKLPGLSCSQRCGVEWDQTKLVVCAMERGYSGYELAQYLWKKAAIQVEMAELHQVLFLVTIGHRAEDIDRLLVALAALPVKEPSLSLQDVEQLCRHLSSGRANSQRPRRTVREALYTSSEPAELEQAVDRTCAALLYCYPPGVPLLSPGQPLSYRAVEVIITQRRFGGSIQGGADPTLETVLVLEENDE